MRTSAMLQLERALHLDQPFPYTAPAVGRKEHFDALPRGAMGGGLARDAGCSVLDPTCVAALLAHPSARTFVDFVDRPDDVASLVDHWLVREMRQALLEHNLPAVVLSLSGGVDSMVHLVLLWAVLQYDDCNFNLAALHITYPSTPQALPLWSSVYNGPHELGAVTDEEEWIAKVCSRLGVPLYMYRMPMLRPSQGRPTGLSHSEYEEATTRARFRMYKQTAHRLGFTEAGWVAVVAHHQDDVDENRLVSLGRGKRVRIDGMRALCSVDDVAVLRPLLHVRKADLQDLAKQLPVCYVQDDPPCLRQMVRGALRSEWLLANGSRRQRKLQGLLRQVGRLSESLDHALAQWALGSLWQRGGFRHSQFFPVSVLQARRKELHGLSTGSVMSFRPRARFGGSEDEGVGVWACGIDIATIMEPGFLQQISEHLMAMEQVVAQVGEIWNPLVNDAPSASPLGSAAAGPPTAACWPLKSIHASVDAGDLAEVEFLVLRAALDAITEHPQSTRVLGGRRGRPFLQRAVRHLWKLMRARDAAAAAYRLDDAGDSPSLPSSACDVHLHGSRHEDARQRHRQLSASGFLSRSVYYHYDAALRFLTLFRDDGRSSHGAVEECCSISSRSRRGWKQHITRQFASAVHANPGTSGGA